MADETGKPSGKFRHDHAHSWMIFFATLCGLCGFAVNPVLIDESAQSLTWFLLLDLCQNRWIFHCCPHPCRPWPQILLAGSPPDCGVFVTTDHHNRFSLVRARDDPASTRAHAAGLEDIVTKPLEVFYNSAAIVLGENIGTTVTAWLAALGANTNAKRAVRSPFFFNVIQADPGEPAA